MAPSARGDVPLGAVGVADVNLAIVQKFPEKLPGNFPVQRRGQRHIAMTICSRVVLICDGWSRVRSVSPADPVRSFVGIFSLEHDKNSKAFVLSEGTLKPLVLPFVAYRRIDAMLRFAG